MPRVCWEAGRFPTGVSGERMTAVDIDAMLFYYWFTVYYVRWTCIMPPLGERFVLAVRYKLATMDYLVNCMRGEWKGWGKDYFVKRSDITWWKQGYIRPPLPYAIVLASLVKTKEVKVIEFHRILQTRTFGLCMIIVGRVLFASCEHALDVHDSKWS